MTGEGRARSKAHPLSAERWAAWRRVPGPSGPSRSSGGSGTTRSRRYRGPALADPAIGEEPGLEAARLRIGDELSEREVPVDEPLLPFHGDGDAPDGDLHQRLQRGIHERKDEREQPLDAARAGELLLHVGADALQPRVEVELRT